MIIYCLHLDDGTSYTDLNILNICEKLNSRNYYLFSGPKNLYDIFVGLCITMGYKHDHIIFDYFSYDKPVKISGYITATEYHND